MFSGILIVFKLLQPAKASLLIDTTELGIDNEFRLKQLQKDASPMDVTELGIDTEARL